MKFRTSLVLSLACVALAAMSSCSKNYTCHCDIKYSGSPGLPDSTTREYNITDSKSGAKSKCTGASGTYTNNGVVSTETCYIY